LAQTVREKSMRAVAWVLQCYQRLRYPDILPSDIAADLGLAKARFLNFDDLFNLLTDENCSLKRLSRFMPREKAEAVFSRAQRQERFGRSALYSYYFNEGWLEFILHFDEEARLRRVYFQHKRLQTQQRVELAVIKNFSGN